MDMMTRALQGAISAQDKQAHQRIGCPVDKDELGRATWALLHTTAAYYPDTPTAREKFAALAMIESLAILYPCSYCRQDLEDFKNNSLPDVSSRESFSKWLCQFHNHVNELQGKPQFPCELAQLDERWRTGAPECNIGGSSTTSDSLGRSD